MFMKVEFAGDEDTHCARACTPAYFCVSWQNFCT